jgi:hypothetical protein
VAFLQRLGLLALTERITTAFHPGDEFCGVVAPLASRSFPGFLPVPPGALAPPWLFPLLPLVVQEPVNFFFRK